MSARLVDRKSRRKQPIAVIEEIADDIYSVKFILQSLGFKVRSFSYQDPLPSALAEFSPQLILVDMMIPQGGGYEVIQTLRGSDLAGVPMLAITAEAMEGDEEAVRKAGVADVLSKPYTVAQLQEKLDKLLPPSEE